MATFTCITDVRNSIHLSQHSAEHPAAALRDHIAALPFSDATGPFDDELDWLLAVSGGSQPIALLPVGGCKNSWLWHDGAIHDPQYLTYVVKTDLT